MIDIQCEAVSKRYKIIPDTTGKPRNLLSKLRPKRDHFWAVKNVSFQVRTGETLGIIGPNGAGKSTVLKMLSGITAPSCGVIKIRGRLAALIEVGSGFHPELSGLENVYLSGSILGMPRREITRKLESIIDFAEVRPFIHTPVKRYSSGMYVRLAFSVAAHLDADVLVLDEVLAVGDSAFQMKCMDRFAELRKRGVTLLYISHDLATVERACDRVLLMNRGEIIADGNPYEVTKRYQRMASGVSARREGKRRDSVGTDQIEITSFRMFDEHGEQRLDFRTGHPMIARIAYNAHERLTDVSFHIDFWSQDGELACNFMSEQSGGPIELDTGPGEIEFQCPELGLRPGIYKLEVGVKPRAGMADFTLGWVHDCEMIRVDPGKPMRGSFFAPNRWTMRPNGG